MTYLFAHSTEQSIQTMRKNSVFYLLGELDKDDKPTGYFARKKNYGQFYKDKSEFES